VFPALGKVDEVLCMTVRPGYGGQAFMPEVLPSIKSVWEEAQRIGKSDLTIMVDGGINRQTGIQCAELGANAFVAGTFLFRAADMATEITMLRDATTRALPKP
jgi:ribulose-phosphate 3-epimerase